MVFKSNVIRSAEIVCWAIVLPWVGYWLLSIRMVGIPLFVLWADPLGTARLVFAAGFLPSLVPAAAFVLLRRVTGRFAAVLISMILSAGACWFWWRTILPADSGFALTRAGTQTILAIAALAPVIFILAFIPRKWLTAPEPIRRESAFARMEDRLFRRLFPGD